MKIYLRNIANNPYVVFVLAWSFSLILYAFRGAAILPELTLGLSTFILSFIILFTLTAFFLKKVGFILKPSKPVNVNYKILFLVNNILFLPNFLYSGIPILSGLRDTTFGIGSEIVIAIAFNSFTCVCFYYMYLTTRKKKFIWYCVYCLALFFIIVSRGFVMMTLITMFFLWMNVKNPVLTFKKIIIISVSALFVLYIFGVAGNLRSVALVQAVRDYKAPGTAEQVPYSSDIIFELGQASDVFQKNVIPGEFFWSYIYLTSPLGNLQYNINISRPPFNVDSFYLAVVDETLFDFISKRINALHKGYMHKMPVLLIDSLTVCTTFAGAYAVAGYGGMIYVLFFFWLFPIFYMSLVSKNPLSVIGVSTLCTIYFFSIFDNMFVISGLSLQMFFPIILMALQNLRFKKADETTAQIQGAKS